MFSMLAQQPHTYQSTAFEKNHYQILEQYLNTKLDYDDVAISKRLTKLSSYMYIYLSANYVDHKGEQSVNK